MNDSPPANAGMLDAYGIDGCGCWRCVDEVVRKRPSPYNLMYPFIICSSCGNKRCPKASWHGYKCTGLNVFGQTPEVENSDGSRDNP